MPRSHFHQTCRNSGWQEQPQQGHWIELVLVDLLYFHQSHFSVLSGYFALISPLLSHTFIIGPFILPISHFYSFSLHLNKSLPKWPTPSSSETNKRHICESSHPFLWLPTIMFSLQCICFTYLKSELSNLQMLFFTYLLSPQMTPTSY